MAVHAVEGVDVPQATETAARPLPTARHTPPRAETNPAGEQPRQPARTPRRNTTPLAVRRVATVPDARHAVERMDAAIAMGAATVDRSDLNPGTTSLPSLNLMPLHRRLEREQTRRAPQARAPHLTAPQRRARIRRAPGRHVLATAAMAAVAPEGDPATGRETAPATVPVDGRVIAPAIHVPGPIAPRWHGRASSVAARRDPPTLVTTHTPSCRCLWKPRLAD